MARKKLMVDDKEIVKHKDAFDWIELAEKLQDALSKEMIENQQLQQERAGFLNAIARQEVIIQYLESKFK